MQKTIGTSGVICLALTGPLLTSTSPAAAQPVPLTTSDSASDYHAPLRKKVVLGFRSNVAPFSFRAAASSSPPFQGYLAELCYQIFAGSETYEVISKEIKIDDRFTSMRGSGAEVSKDNPIDVLCDPVTIRYNDSPERYRYGIFSPIVFATGVTYLERSISAPNVASQFGFVSGSTAQAVATQMYSEAKSADIECPAPESKTGNSASANAASDPQSKPDSSLEVFLRQLTDRNEQENCNTLQAGLTETRAHEDLISWFCDAPQNTRRYYFGDREIINAHWTEYRQKNPECDAKLHTQLFTYEPYALLITRTDPALVQFVQQRVYEIFSDREKARALFSANFPGQHMTPALAYLFLLNGVNGPGPVLEDVAQE